MRQQILSIYVQKRSPIRQSHLSITVTLFLPTVSSCLDHYSSLLTEPLPSVSTEPPMIGLKHGPALTAPLLRTFRCLPSQGGDHPVSPLV